ncbi:uncharacterized protein UTRI_06159_B [Ustilago trichophora]|uniref:C3H1-type domain-containing protein n=1 Tax=Ustilago trichophora TaxID=86804 RepID=A0A5C3EGV8_9BASI|nr:uncharacterized protein UTRI_06159_B [Ustilago trichophora]
MTSTSEEERLKAEIAKLSGAIQTHKQQQHQPSQYPSYGGSYASRGRGYYAGANSSSYRGAYAGGRGGYHAPSTAGRGRARGTASIPPRNRTLILNDSNAKATPAATSSSSADDKADATGTATQGSANVSASSSSTSSISTPTDGWIKRKSTHNMSLVSTSTFQRTEPARLAAIEATRKAKAEAKAAASSSSSGKKAIRAKPAKPSSSVRRGDNMGEVVIDGVVFEFDPSGTKLVKKAAQPSSEHTTTQDDSASTSTAVPLKTSINGQDYIRTKRGNLISASLLAKRKAQRETAAKMGRLDKMVGQISAIQATRNASSRSKPGSSSRILDVKKSRTLCSFFNKTGQCKRGLSCPYLHDSSKIALCPKVLRPSGCTLPKGMCPLSHTPRAERVPHCVHYLRTGNCRNGDECLYTHSDKLVQGVETKICRNFSDYGWCDKGKECEERHTYECPDFVEKGRCDRKGCKLVHVIRATAANDGGERVEEQGDEGEGMGDGMLFMRDDAAAADETLEDEEEEEEASRKRKRKRPLMQTELDDDQQVLPEDEGVNEEEEDDDDERVNFANTNETRTAKRRKAKAFTQQKDFISFDDDEKEEEEEDESDEREEVSDDDDEGEEDASEVGSVHSEDFELSGAEEDEGKEEDLQEAETQDEEQEEENANDDEDQDDDLVDRDL